MKRSFRFLLSISTGILLSGAWLGFPGWTLFIAFLPLLMLDKFFADNSDRFRGVSFWGHSFLAFFIWNITTTWWIAHATVLGAAMAILVNSFLMSAVWWLIHTARRNFKAGLGYIALIVFWISFESFHYHWDIEWPWLTLGNGFANNVKMIQWYQFTGVFGGTLWILVMNILIFYIIQNIIQKSTVRFVYNFFWALVFLIIPLWYSYHAYNSYVEEYNPQNIVIVQPNIDPYSESYDMSAEEQKLKKFIQLAESKANDSTDFIIGPETVFENPGYWNEALLNSNKFVQNFCVMLQKYNDARLVFGVSSFIVYPDEAHASATARKNRDSYYDLYNTAIYLNKEGGYQIYHKSKLVVGVEKMPFMKYLGFIKDIVINIGGTTGSLGRQKESSNFTADEGVKVAPVICYESVFGEYVASYVKKGAQLIFIITNDGWWKNTPGYKQHMAFARLRAIETRRSIARSANTGISCFINQRGDVFQPTGWWVDAAIKQSVNANDELTFYVKNGDYIARISLFVSVLLILYLISTHFLKDKKKPH
jgi:apolipoprotein N-acyltransferase